jgi:predicted nucleotidyltransferase
MTIARDERIASDPALSLFLERTRDLRAAGVSFVLFGSRVRDNWRPDSDYDILVVLPHRNAETKSRLYDAVVDVLSDTGKLISLKIFDRTTYERLAAIPTPFMANVLREGMPIG